MQWLRGGTRKTTLIRVLHAVMFEVGLMFVLLPLFAWYLGISLWQAFLMDVSFALFLHGLCIRLQLGIRPSLPVARMAKTRSRMIAIHGSGAARRGSFILWSD